jgi:hypothetical protein
MFRPIRVDNTNCLQVDIKTHSIQETVEGLGTHLDGVVVKVSTSTSVDWSQTGINHVGTQRSRFCSLLLTLVWVVDDTKLSVLHGS